jgi:hypothetical protein
MKAGIACDLRPLEAQADPRSQTNHAKQWLLLERAPAQPRRCIIDTGVQQQGRHVG